MKYTDKTARTFSALIGLTLVLSQPLFAQIPTGTPRSDEPINLNSTADIIIYVVLPLAIIVLGIFWWFFYKKPKNKKDKNKGMD